MKTTRIITAFILILLFTHCSQRRGATVDPAGPGESSDDQSSLQIQPLIPEAVKTLIAESNKHLAQGNEQSAILALERALRITPDSPLVQQHMAETLLTKGDYQQAFNWSRQVAEQGPQFGSLCERSWRTMALAAEMLGNTEQQVRALESITGCQQQPLPRF